MKGGAGLVLLTERAQKELEQLISDDQPDVYVRLMMVMEGG